MEERLFWIGLGMGLYTWGTRHGMKTGRLENRVATTVWHALFCMLAGFAGAMVIAMSIDSRSGSGTMAVGLLSARELYLSVMGGLFFGVWGASNAWRKAHSPAGRKFFHVEDLEWAETVFSAVLLASMMMYFVVQAFKIPSGSMRSTLLEGDHLFVNKFIYGIRIPFTHVRILRLRPVRRGDVVVFRFPTENPEEEHCGGIQYGKDFIKRVIGLEGDEIKVVGGVLYVNGESRAGRETYAQYLWPYRLGSPPIPLKPEQYQELWQTHQLDRAIAEKVGMVDVIRDNFGPVKVPPGGIFAMGDNRDHSCDSRFWGPVPLYFLKGKAWFLYWPPGRMGLVH